jgi:hypothetical protein
LSEIGDEAEEVEIPDEGDQSEDGEKPDETDEVLDEDFFNPNDKADETLDEDIFNPNRGVLDEGINEDVFNTNVDESVENLSEDIFDPNVDPSDERFHEEKFDPNINPSDERFHEEKFNPNIDPSDERFHEECFDPNVDETDESLDEQENDGDDEEKENPSTTDNHIELDITSESDTDEIKDEGSEELSEDEKDSKENLTETNSSVESENIGTDQSTVILHQESQEPFSRDKEGNIILDADTMEFFGEHVSSQEEMEVEVLEEEMEELFKSYEEQGLEQEDGTETSHDSDHENNQENQELEQEIHKQQQEETTDQKIEQEQEQELSQEHSQTIIEHATNNVESNNYQDGNEELQESIQKDIPETKQEIAYKKKEPREKNQEIEQESIQEAYYNFKESDIREQYKQETGKRPIYARKETKGFIKWKERLNQNKEEQEEKHNSLNVKEEEYNEQQKEPREEWGEYIANSIKESEFSEEIAENIIEFLEKYETLRELLRRLKTKEISEDKFEKEVKDFESILVEKRDIAKPLFMNFDWYRRYYDETIRKSGKRVAKLYISKKTREFLSHISRRIEQLKKADNLDENIYNFEEFQEKSFQIREKWALLLNKLIYEVPIKEISTEAKEELETVIKRYCEIRTILFNSNILKEDKEKLIQGRIEKVNPRFFELFEILKRFLGVYNNYSRNWMEKSLILEGKKTIRHLSQNLEKIKNERVLHKVLNKESSSFQNLMEILKENLYKNITLKLNEKSAIIKIIQKNKPNEVKSKLLTTLSKLPTAELISLLGNEFKKQTQKIAKMDSDYELFDDFLHHIHNIQFVNELITEFNKSGNWMKNFRPTQTFIHFINEKKEELVQLSKDESNNTIKNQIKIISKFSSLLTKIRENDILNKVIKAKIINNPGKYNAYDIRKWLLLSDTSTRNQLNRILTKEEYQQCIRTQTHASLDTIRNIAAEKRGKCHTKSLKNAKSKLHLECVEGHHFFPRYDSVVYKNTWCPHCHIYMSEAICRKFFEKIFNRPFPKSYPEWLINEKGNQMELDGYSEDLGLAFEYQGIQHRKKAFGKTDEELQNIQKEDALKLKKCGENNVVLLQIPDDEIVPYNKMQEYIIKEYEKITGKTLKSIPKFDYREFTIHENKYAIKFREYVEEKGGTLMTPYFSAKKEVKLLCEKGHQWTTTPDSIYKDNWCSECSGNMKGTTIFFRKIGKMFNCELINEYVNAKTLISYKCQNGHNFEKSPYWLKKDFKKIEILCPKCNMSLFAEKFQEIVTKKGGQLVTQYNGRFKPITIKCNNNHTWNTTPATVYQGSWCKFCADESHPNKERLQTAKKELVQMIEALKYSLLSEYENNTKKVQIKCRNHHQFTMTPKYFKRLVNQNIEPCIKCRKES